MNSSVPPKRSRPALVGMFTSIICAGFLVQGGTLPASAQPSPPPEVSSQDSGEVEAAATRKTTLDVDAWRVSLSEGRVVTTKGEASPLPSEVGEGLSTDVFTIRGDEAGMILSYRVKMLDEPTDYWIQFASVNSSASGQATRCEVYDNDPIEGVSLADPSPFTCIVESDNRAFLGQDLHVTLHLALNREAEASGTITARDLSLSRGTFRDYVPYHRNGAATIADGQSTSFSTVMREGDQPDYAKQARTEWAYQIIDPEGAETGVWVAGLSTNYRGTVKFSGDARCAFYDHNPLADNGLLDDAQSIENNTYTCQAAGFFVREGIKAGNGHFDATFLVAKK